MRFAEAGAALFAQFRNSRSYRAHAKHVPRIAASMLTAPHLAVFASSHAGSHGVLKAYSDWLIGIFFWSGIILGVMGIWPVVVCPQTD